MDLFQLKCEECGRGYGNAPLVVCEDCFAPLRIEYDLERVRERVSRGQIESRPSDIWRYRELLPLPAGHERGLPVGFTPLLRAPRLGSRIGSGDLWLKDDAACFPTLSFKDRVVAVALAQAQAFGFQVVGCASTGNLGNALAAQAARLGLEAWIFLPVDLEPAKVVASAVYGAHLVQVDGTYDQVNRLCAEICESRPWGFVNVNLRAYYAEGSKSVGFEIAEQLGWRLPDNVVVPMAGGAQITRIARSFAELVETGLVEPHPVRVFGAQAEGCSPIAGAVSQSEPEIRPQDPRTICRSLSIGNPADGYDALRAIHASGGWAGTATDSEIVDGMRTLAEEEGVFGETAAGVTVTVAARLLAEGRIGAGETTVLCLTGNGLKTVDPLARAFPPQPVLAPQLDAFEARLGVPAGVA